MKYMLLVHHDEVTFAERSESERQQLMQESIQLANQLHSERKYVNAAPLHPTAETLCVKVRDNKRFVTDGPFAETREQLGGFFLIDAKDREDAINIAARIPGARIGTVEVRAVTEVEGLPQD
ncbi:MAG TPA: YciI family protein [Pyrinomonadaceae bacterium]|nr:YciI family protein [Pyrinomonadaceae bacterium]